MNLFTAGSRRSGAKPILKYQLERQKGPDQAQLQRQLEYHNPLTNADEVGTIVKLDNGTFAAVTRSQSEAYAAADDVQRLLLAVLAGCLLALGLLAWLIQRSISRSVRTLAQAAAGLVIGDVDQDISLDSGDDLGRMAGAFRELIGYR